MQNVDAGLDCVRTLERRPLIGLARVRAHLNEIPTASMLRLARTVFHGAFNRHDSKK